ncbi:MAG TPA: transglycosylase domain-containing protein [Xanthobacteraceae bacterium]|nr:transglycosylase domain-containing protein [Xanthobacteraceae bacterium]
MTEGHESQSFYRRSRLLRPALSFVVAVFLAPYLLTILYSFINPVSTLMLWREATGQRVQRIYLPLERAGPLLPLMVIVAEDGRFCSHFGVDFQELQQIVEEADDLKRMRGGSSITQQVAKNLFLWPGRSYLRKALEFPLALWIDLVLSKRRIMEIYLNIAEWGPNGEFGAEAGARRAFGKPARQLGAFEAAALAAMLPDPAHRNPSNVRRLGAIYAARAAAAAWQADCLKRR